MASNPSGSSAQTLGDLTRSAAAVRGAATALIEGDECVSFRELDEASCQLAHALLATGLEPGARIAYLAKDSIAAYQILFGSAKAGTVLMGINWRLTGPEIRYILDHGEAQLLFLERAFADVLASIRPELPHLQHVVWLDGAPPAVERSATGDCSEQAYPSWKAGRPKHDPWLDRKADDASTRGLAQHAVDAEDVVVQMYTSGTTGLPKGVMLPHRSFFAVIASMAAVGDPWIGFSPDDVALHTLPLFHIGGIWFDMTALAAGTPLVVTGTFTAWSAIQLMQKHAVSKVCLVPAMIQMVLAEPECKDADWTALDCIVYGGSPIPVPVLQRALEVFGCRFAQIYGLTETGNTAVCLRPEDHADPEHERMAAAGRPYPGVAAKVIDEQGRELGVREVGEVCLASPANMLGYWKNPEATASTLVGGWVHTGDAGFLDEQGFLFVNDRLKDMIIYAGENIYPAEIESALCGHPAVAEAAVIGVPDERWGEQVKAIVVLRDGEQASARSILSDVRSRLAAFKVPKSVDFVQSLPRTPSGKIQKHVLRAPYWAGRDRQVN